MFIIKRILLICFICITPALYSAVFTVTNTDSNGPGSLFQATLDNNATPELNTINFEIPGTGPHTIDMSNSFPLIITNPVVINGYSQDGSSPNTNTDGSTNAQLAIILNGKGLEVNRGLYLNIGSDGSTIRGLVINEFRRDGILIESSNNHTIVGNFIGTSSDGLSIARNKNGIRLAESFLGITTGNRIGGTSPQDVNIIAGSFGVFEDRVPNGGCIFLEKSNGNSIQGNLIGTDRTGTQVLGESMIGICLSFASSNNEIGNLSRNIISGHTIWGLCIYGDDGIEDEEEQLFAENNLVQSNYIGTDVTGTNPLPNTIGINIDTRVNNTTITNNLISGNYKFGIQVGSSASNILNRPTTDNLAFLLVPPVDTHITNNLIGTDATGSQELGNGAEGISIEGARLTRIESNTISANNRNGIRLVCGTEESTLISNFIGTDITGTQPLGNKANGIALQSVPGFNLLRVQNNVIGSLQASERNVIANNGKNGISIEPFSISTVVQGNYIGTSLTGLEMQRPNCQAYGNGENGVYILCSSNNLLENNIITRNGKAGVAVEGEGEDAVDNAIVSNQIFNNCELGIDLGRDGITANDVQDPDLGPNRLQNFPVFTSVRRCGSATRVSGVLNSIANTSFLIQFFSNDVDRPGITEGKNLIGELTVTTDGNGNAAFKQSFDRDTTSGYFISATATRLEGDLRIETSEFNKGGLARSCLTNCLASKLCSFKEACVIDCN